MTVGIGSVTVTSSQILNIAPKIFANNVARAIGVEGPPGCGKTATGMQIASRMEQLTGEKYNTFQVNLAVHEPTDVGGIPYVKEELGIARMGKAISEWWPREGNNVIVVEEITKAPKLMQNALGEAIHEGTIGSFRLPKNTYFYLSWNRRNDGAGDERLLSHFVNRLILLNYSTSPDELISHAIRNGWNAKVCAFLSQFKHMVFDEKTFSNKDGNKYNPEKPVFASPRGWEKVAKTIDLDLPDTELIPVLCGTVGEGPTRELIAFMQIMNDMPDVSLIETAPKTTPLPKEMSVMYALAISLAYGAKKETVDNIATYIGRMRKEYQVLWIKALSERNPSLLEKSQQIRKLANGLMEVVIG